MAVKILIKRRFKEGHFNEINKMLKKVRYGAMDEDGYLSSETLWDHEDPFRVVVASNWRSIDDWKRWSNSPSAPWLIFPVWRVAREPTEASGTPTRRARNTRCPSSDTVRSPPRRRGCAPQSDQSARLT
jgi:quinol monooxygenase YgiN